MKRGGFGKPYRKPAGGWPLAIPPYSQCYNHRQPALNGLAKFVNTTNDLPLQQNQVGRPTSRPAVVDMGEYSC